jgi:hypothetical protein
MITLLTCKTNVSKTDEHGTLKFEGQKGLTSMMKAAVRRMKDK